MKLYCLFFVVIYLVNSLSCYTIRDEDYFSKYDQHSVYKVYLKSDSHFELLKYIEEAFSIKLDYWTEPRIHREWFDVMVKPDDKEIFESTLKAFSVKYTISIPDVSHLIKKQLALNAIGKKAFDNLEDFDYGKYHTLDEINDWMNLLENTYPKYVTIFNVSRSYQKRNINAIKISIPNASNKPAIWLDGGIHAREWISPATVIYIANAFLQNYKVDINTTKVLEAFDIYILPVFNVDGYEYTWVKDRMWRKTRSKTVIPGCVGVDPNRNWDAHFSDGGASKDPCSDAYCGPKAFSESEVRGVADFLLKNNDHIVSYVNFHSYSQLWMSPYGYTKQLPVDYKTQDQGSIAAITALKRINGTEYEHGPIYTTIYEASGSSSDWAYDTAKIVYSYGVELRDQGQYGFLLPPDQIIPSGIETFEAIKSLAFYIYSQL